MLNCILMEVAYRERQNVPIGSQAKFIQIRIDLDGERSAVGLERIGNLADQLTGNQIFPGDLLSNPASSFAIASNWRTIRVVRSTATTIWRNAPSFVASSHALTAICACVQSRQRRAQLVRRKRRQFPFVSHGGGPCGTDG